MKHKVILPFIKPNGGESIIQNIKTTTNPDGFVEEEVKVSIFRRFLFWFFGGLSKLVYRRKIKPATMTEIMYEHQIKVDEICRRYGIKKKNVAYERGMTEQQKVNIDRILNHLEDRFGRSSEAPKITFTAGGVDYKFSVGANLEVLKKDGTVIHGTLVGIDQLMSREASEIGIFLQCSFHARHKERNKERECVALGDIKKIVNH